MILLLNYMYINIVAESRWARLDHSWSDMTKQTQSPALHFAQTSAKSSQALSVSQVQVSGINAWEQEIRSPAPTRLKESN